MVIVRILLILISRKQWRMEEFWFITWNDHIEVVMLKAKDKAASETAEGWKDMSSRKDCSDFKGWIKQFLVAKVEKKKVGCNLRE